MMNVECRRCHISIFVPDDTQPSSQYCIDCLYRSRISKPEISVVQSYTGDPIVDKVIQQLIDRSKLGQKKYNTTLKDNNLGLKQWLQHILEELMDACNYIQKTIDLL